MASNPLNIEINDESLKGIFEKNPFYIDVKGSINICQIMCGQTFENNNVKLSSMTNFGKVLVLNPNNKEKIQANIKLAFDSSNDDTDENGNSSYTLKKIFFTVPSFHRVNGIIADFESYIVYASTQKNGNTLYSVICTLYNGSTQLPTNEHELLTYKFFDELFINNNVIPEKFGTKAIKTPDNIDLTELIPEKGNQSFYEYVNPKNPNVNIRIFQNKMSISNSCIEVLKAKLTPGVEYSNFKQNIGQQLNPEKGLFFFYSQDLTNNYKNYVSSNKSKEKMIDYDNLVESIEEDNEMSTEEEQVVLIQKLKQTHFEKKEKYVNFDESSSSNEKIYEIDPTTGLIRTLNDNDSSTNDPLIIYDNLHDVMAKNPKYDIDEVKKSIEQFPNYVYQNSCWRYDYTIVLYEVKEKLDVEKYTIENVELKIETEDEQIIKNATKKIGLDKTDIKDVKEVFYAMKNFPNYEVKNYYISYFYTSSDSKSKFRVIIGVVIFWALLLINYLFYRLVFTIGNTNYTNKTVTDNDILVNDEMKNLASNRLWINVLFIIQIACTIIYSLLSISGIVSNDTGFSTFIVILIGIIMYLIYKYVCKRFQFTSEQVSYIENHSLKVFLERGMDKHNSQNMVSKDNVNNIKQNIQNGGAENNLENVNLGKQENTISIFFKNMMDLLISFSISLPNQAQNKIQDLFIDLYTKIDNLEDENRKIELIEQINILKKFIDYSQDDEDSKNKAQELIQTILKELPQNKKEGDPLEEIKQNLKNMKSTYLVSTKNKMKDTLGLSGGNPGNPEIPLTFGNTREINEIPKIPFTFGNTREITNENIYGTPTILKNEFNSNDDDYESNSIINGKPLFPDLEVNQKNNKESYDKSDWWSNFWNQTLEIKNSILFTLFVVLILMIIYKLSDIYMLYDMHKEKDWFNLSSYNLLNINVSLFVLLFIRTSALFYLGYWFSFLIKKVSIDYLDFDYSTDTFKHLITFNKILLGVFIGLIFIFLYSVKKYNKWVIFGFLLTFLIVLMCLKIYNSYKSMNLEPIVNSIFCCSIILIVIYILLIANDNTSINNIINSVLIPFIIVYFGYTSYNYYKNMGSSSDNIPMTLHLESGNTSGITSNELDKPSIESGNIHIPLLFSNGLQDDQQKFTGGLIRELNEKLTKLGGMLSNKKTNKNDIQKNIESLRQLQQLLPKDDKNSINSQIDTLIGNLENFKDLKMSK